MAPTRILVVEDDPDLRAVLGVLLASEGYEVSEAAEGERGLELANGLQPALVVLDVDLPGINGVEVCRRLRQTSNVPVLFLTAASSEIDELVGFAAGGDDYIAKPFAPHVLIARIQALLRRVHDVAANNGDVVVTANVRIDLLARNVAVSGTELDLTRTELGILEVLAQNLGRITSRDELLNAVWGSTFGDKHVVDVNLSRLRAKLTAAGAPPKLITTHRGLGYRLNLTENPDTPPAR